LITLLNTLDKSEEEKREHVENIEEDIRTCVGGGKIPPKNAKDLEEKINPHLSESI